MKEVVIKGTSFIFFPYGSENIYSLELYFVLNFEKSSTFLNEY